VTETQQNINNYKFHYVKKPKRDEASWFVLFAKYIIRIIKSRRMRWAGHVARMGRRGTLIDYWWESQRERDH
jgi:hypothetical protein